MAKQCVFCGGIPEKKTKEHVLPQWLLEETGDPSRTVYLGLIKDFRNGFRPREFAFDQFCFPACDRCNNQYSGLEDQAKSVLRRIMCAAEVDVGDASLLLDWFDKVRVGLWLGLNQLDKNYVGIQPSFFIASRIGQYDRLLCVEKSDSTRNKLNFGGADTISFAFTPSAFTLIINKYYFTNVSSMFLVSRRLGFPYPREAHVCSAAERIEVKMDPGRERVALPLIRRRMPHKGPVLYQPMFPGGLIDGSMSIYDTPYVRRHSLDHARGRGNLFLESNGGIREYYSGEKVSLEPQHLQHDQTLFVQSAIHVCEWQNWLNSQLPSLDKLSRQERAYIKKRFGMADRQNALLINHHRSVLTGQDERKLP